MPTSPRHRYLLASRARPEWRAAARPAALSDGSVLPGGRRRVGCGPGFGVGPAIPAQVTILLATLIVLRMPGNQLADPEEPLGSRLALTVLLLVLTDGLAWRLERKGRAAALRDRGFRESETRYRHVLEQASDGILLAAADGRLVLANQRICELLGYSEAELLQVPLVTLYADGEAEDAARWDDPTQLSGGRNQSQGGPRCWLS
jgi:PAS domain-containing protein